MTSSCLGLLLMLFFFLLFPDRLKSPDTLLIEAIDVIGGWPSYLSLLNPINVLLLDFYLNNLTHFFIFLRSIAAVPLVAFLLL